MAILLMMVALAAGANWLGGTSQDSGWQAGYRSGKRHGSRKAYGVGYARGRRAGGGAPPAVNSAGSGCTAILVTGLLVWLWLCS